jgi:hypothetical protein
LQYFQISQVEYSDIDKSARKYAKIADMPLDMACMELGKQCLEIWELLGITASNTPSELACSVFTKWYIEAYSELHIHELTLAFQYAFNGTIEVSLNHYQSFSVPFVKQVMDTYVQYRKDAIRKVDKLISDYEGYQDYLKNHSNANRLNHEAVIEILTEYWRCAVNGEKATNAGMVVIDNILAYIADAKGPIYTEQTYQKLLQEAVQEVKATIQERNTGNIKHIRKLLTDGLKIDTQASHRANHKILVMYMQKCSRNGMDCKAFIDYLFGSSSYINPQSYINLLQSEPYKINQVIHRD